MIVLGGSQFTRYNLSVSSLCLKERPKYKIRPYFLYVWLATSLVARKPAFLHHLWGKEDYQALFAFRPRTRFMSFSPLF